MEHITLNFENDFASLSPVFYTKMNAEGFAKVPFLIHTNPAAGSLIDLNSASLNMPDFPQYFSGNKNMPGSAPLAMVYSGHQFGHYVPQLGDGRALLLGQVRNKAGERWDIQIKGGGLTPYSRMGDGRAVLRSTIREYLCSEAMHALGVPTTRALCIVGTGEIVERETTEPGAILTRLSPSHIRFGHFEYFHHTGQIDAVRQLADHVITEHYPDGADDADRYHLFFYETVARTARLMAQWMACGFSHGVMNSDNMSILGLTIDYGPFGFMEGFDPHYICNHSDTGGRYAYNQQPAIGFWNLQVLAYALQSLLDFDRMRASLADYTKIMTETYNNLMARKLGLETPDINLIQDFLNLMAQHRSDYTHSFRTLSRLNTDSDTAPFLALFHNDDKAKDWLSRYFKAANARDGMLAINPKYILRNWVAESVIRAAEDNNDYTLIGDILHVLQNPYDEHPEQAYYAGTAPAGMDDLCVSCSS